MADLSETLLALRIIAGWHGALLRVNQELAVIAAMNPTTPQGQRAAQALADLNRDLMQLDHDLS